MKIKLKAFVEYDHDYNGWVARPKSAPLSTGHVAGHGVNPYRALAALARQIEVELGEMKAADLFEIEVVSNGRSD